MSVVRRRAGRNASSSETSVVNPVSRGGSSSSESTNSRLSGQAISHDSGTRSPQEFRVASSLRYLTDHTLGSQSGAQSSHSNPVSFQVGGISEQNVSEFTGYPQSSDLNAFHDRINGHARGDDDSHLSLIARTPTTNRYILKMLHELQIFEEDLLKLETDGYLSSNRVVLYYIGMSDSSDIRDISSIMFLTHVEYSSLLKSVSSIYSPSPDAVENFVRHHGSPDEVKYFLRYPDRMCNQLSVLWDSFIASGKLIYPMIFSSHALRRVGTRVSDPHSLGRHFYGSFSTSLSISFNDIMGVRNTVSNSVVSFQANHLNSISTSGLFGSSDTVPSVVGGADSNRSSQPKRISSFLNRLSGRLYDKNGSCQSLSKSHHLESIVEFIMSTNIGVQLRGRLRGNLIDFLSRYVFSLTKIPSCSIDLLSDDSAFYDPAKSERWLILSTALLEIRCLARCRLFCNMFTSLQLRYVPGDSGDTCSLEITLNDKNSVFTEDFMIYDRLWAVDKLCCKVFSYIRENFTENGCLDKLSTWLEEHTFVAILKLQHSFELSVDNTSVIQSPRSSSGAKKKLIDIRRKISEKFGDLRPPSSEISKAFTTYEGAQSFFFPTEGIGYITTVTHDPTGSLCMRSYHIPLNSASMLFLINAFDIRVDVESDVSRLKYLCDRYHISPITHDEVEKEIQFFFAISRINIDCIRAFWSCFNAISIKINASEFVSALFSSDFCVHNCVDSESGILFCKGCPDTPDELIERVSKDRTRMRAHMDDFFLRARDLLVKIQSNCVAHNYVPFFWNFGVSGVTPHRGVFSNLDCFVGMGVSSTRFKFKSKMCDLDYMKQECRFLLCLNSQVKIGEEFGYKHRPERSLRFTGLYPERVVKVHPLFCATSLVAALTSNSSTIFDFLNDFGIWDRKTLLNNERAIGCSDLIIRLLDHRSNLFWRNRVFKHVKHHHKIPIGGPLWYMSNESLPNDVNEFCESYTNLPAFLPFIFTCDSLIDGANLGKHLSHMCGGYPFVISLGNICLIIRVDSISGKRSRVSKVVMNSSFLDDISTTFKQVSFIPDKSLIRHRSSGVSLDSLSGSCTEVDSSIDTLSSALTVGDKSKSQTNSDAKGEKAAKDNRSRKVFPFFSVLSNFTACRASSAINPGNGEVTAFCAGPQRPGYMGSSGTGELGMVFLQRKTEELLGRKRYHISGVSSDIRTFDPRLMNVLKHRIFDEDSLVDSCDMVTDRAFDIDP